jgi:hypothetical protein
MTHGDFKHLTKQERALLAHGDLGGVRYLLTTINALRERELVGQRMSNLCFNLGQEAVTFEPRHRQEMRDLCTLWDAKGTAR